MWNTGGSTGFRDGVMSPEIVLVSVRKHRRHDSSDLRSLYCRFHYPCCEVACASIVANVLKISPRDRCLRQADQHELSQPLRHPRSDALQFLWARHHVQRQAPDCRLLARTPGEGGLAPGGGASIRIIRTAFMDLCWTARVTSLLTIFIRPEP